MVKKEIGKLADNIKDLIDILDPVCSTLGPRGNTVLITKSNTTKATKDGFYVLNALGSEKPQVHMILGLIQKEIEEIAETVGDGTTTATVFIREILVEVNKLISLNYSPQEIIKGITRASDESLKILKKITKKAHEDPQSQQEFMKKVGTVASNGDKHIGELLTEAITKVGKHGVVNIDISNTIYTSARYTEGVSIDRGYASVSREFALNIKDDNQNNKNHKEIILEKPYVLLWNKRISTLAPLMATLEEVRKTGNPILIICEEVENNALRALMFNNLSGALKSVAIKTPSFGDKRKDIMEDISIITGAKFFSDELGHSLQDITIDSLGYADQIKVKENETIIIGGNSNNKEKMQQRIQQLEKELVVLQGEEKHNSYNIEELKNRLAKLTGGVCVIMVGGNSELEMYEKKDRIEDALFAIKGANATGIAVGGGQSFFFIGKELHKKLQKNEFNDLTEVSKMGIEVFVKALFSILKTILNNCTGIPKDVILSDIERFYANKDFEEISKNITNYDINSTKTNIDIMGYDARQNKYVDLLGEGIMDPAIVIETVLKKSASVPCLILNSKYIVYEKKDQEKMNEFSM